MQMQRTSQMKTIQDLKNWLNENGYPEGTADIERMETDDDYQFDVQFEPQDDGNLSCVLSQSFIWQYSELGWDYWNNIFELLVNTTTLKTVNVDEISAEMQVTGCCGIGPIINENYCSNCGKKIIR
jgi:hypothetical protein